MILRRPIIVAAACLVLGAPACGKHKASPAAGSGTSQEAAHAAQGKAAQGATKTRAKAPVDQAKLLEKGKKLYTQTCTACHGPHGEAKPNLGKDIGTSKFVHGLSDDELVAFLKKGRPPGDPMNTTGVLMPPKGGNPALTDDDLHAIVAYVRQLQAQRYGKAAAQGAAKAPAGNKPAGGH